MSQFPPPGSPWGDCSPPSVSFCFLLQVLEGRDHLGNHETFPKVAFPISLESCWPGSEDEHSSQTFHQPKKQLLTPICCLSLFVMGEKKNTGGKNNQWINDALEASHEKEGFVQDLDFGEPKM